MKFKVLSMLLLTALMGVSCSKHTASLKTDVDSLSYALGMATAPDSAQLAMAFPDSTIKIDNKKLLDGMEEGLKMAKDTTKQANFFGLQAGMMMTQQTFPTIEQQLFGEKTDKKVNVDKFIEGFKDGQKKADAEIEKAFKTLNEKMTKLMQSKDSIKMKDDEFEKLAYDMGFTAVSGAKQMMQSSGVAAKNLDKFFEGLKDGLKSRGNSKKLSESLGLMMGLQIANNLFPGVEQQIYASDSTKKISTANYLAGVYDALNHKSSMQYKGKPLTRETANEYIQERINAAAEVEMAKKYGADKQKNEAYMANKAKEAGIQKLPEGVLYKEIKKGSGPIAKENQTVEVQYEGRLINDTIFDKSEKPVTFPVNAVVKGWQVVLTHMPAGSEWEVYIPWKVGYGARGAGQNIPPFSTLIFKMKLISVK